MKIIIDGLHKVFEHRVRLAIMSMLAVNDSLDFTSLKDYLDISDGNLANHLKALEKEGFIGMKKSFVGKKPNTKYFMTKSGRKAFEHHLKTLEHLIKSQR